MFTERLSPQNIDRAVEFLRRNFVIAFPTETVYGLGAPIFNPQAILEIFALKGRPSDNPLIAHISDLSQINRIAIDIPQDFYFLAQAFFPGPLTIVLKKHPNVSSIVSGGQHSIAIRMPKHPIANKLIALLGEPLVAPSANLSGKPSSTTCDHVLEDFQDKIAAVIDGGKAEFGIESTVLSLLHNPPMLLRPGSITKVQIEEVLQCTIAECDLHAKEKALSPGMKYRHYCPYTPIYIFQSQEEMLSAAKKQERPMILTRYNAFTVSKGDHFCLSAKDLYALFRYADAKKYSCILILFDEILLQDPALKNRLLRALEIPGL